MRLINADALQAKMYHEAFEADSDMQNWDSGCWIRYKLFENCIDSMPTIEPEQKKGKWILHQDSRTWECSECHKYQVIHSDYCMHCGQGW